MKTEPANPTNEMVDRVSALLAQILEAPLAAQPEVLAKLCAQNDDCSDILRKGYGSLQQLDLLQISHAAPTVADAVAIVGATTGGPMAAGLPRPLGPFRLLEFIGAGGMGAVYRAEDDELKRPVALKLVRSELLASPRTRSRFQRESAALARLDHPGLCTVYRAGSTDGQPWIAMRLVRGTTLATLIETRRAAQKGQGKDSAGNRASSATREELQGTLIVFEKIARALATAHAVGVVHRDLKPANIVLTSGDEPVVIDFGLVHLEDSDSHLTLSGDHIGTPAYMAPEQIVPAGREPDARTDVYALGVTLFEALTLQSPYDARSREDLFHCIVRGERRRLRRARRGLSADLELVLEKALDPEPARRYASMTELAEDLARVRQHEPPAARRIGPALRLRRWCQRNPVAATFVTLLGLGLGTALVLVASRDAARRRSLAMAYGNLAGQLVDENPEYALDMALCGIDLAPDDPEVLGLLQRALQEVHPHASWPLPWPRGQRVKVDALRVSPRGDAALVLGVPPGQAMAAPILWRRGAPPVLLPIEKGAFDASWSADGSTFVTTAPDSPPELWSISGERHVLEVPAELSSLNMPRARFFPDGDHLLLACSDGIARVHDRKTGSWTALEPRLSKTRPMRGLAFSADGERFALGDQAGCIVVHETAKALLRQPGRVLTQGGARTPKGAAPTKVRELELSRHGDLIQAYSDDAYSCTMWSWEGQLLESWGSMNAAAIPVPMDPTQDRVLRLTTDHAPELWRHANGRYAFDQALAGHVGMLHNGTFRADGQQVMTVGIDGAARIWDTTHARLVLTLHCFGSDLLACGFLGSNQCLVVSEQDLHCFDVPGPDAALPVGAFADLFVEFAGDTWPGSIITADMGQRIAVHDANGKTIKISEPIRLRAGLQLSPDRAWVVSTSRARHPGPTEARIYDLQLRSAQDPIELQMAVPRPAFGPDNQLLVVDVGPLGKGACAHFVADGDGHWPRSADAVQQGFAAACKGAQALAYHAPTTTLAIAAPGAAVRLYRWSAAPPGLTHLRTLLPETATSHRIAFAPDGQRLLLAGTDKVVRLVDREEHVRAEVRGHLGSVMAIGISPRGDKFMVAAAESGVTVHDLDGRLLLPIRPRAGVVSTAAFMPDGERILIATSARTTSIVSIDPKKLVEIARGVTRPSMSPVHLRHYRSRVGDDRND